MWYERNKLLHSALSALLLFTLNACSFSTSDTVNTVSDEQKALTNLDLGLRYMELGRLETALEKLNYALDLDSDNYQIHDAIAVLYQRIGKDAEAEKHFKKALDLKPEDAGVITDYGWFLCNKGQYGKGMELLKQAIAMPLNERKWHSFTNAGLCEYKQGNNDAAEQYLRAALEMQGDIAPALLTMAKINYNKAEFMKTRAFLERYVGAAGQNAESLWYAMQTERKLGNLQQAEEYRQELLRKFPLSDEAKKLNNIY